MEMPSVPDDKNFTPYQKNVIDNYYKNRDTIMQRRLGEIVSDLYLAEGSRKAERLWGKARDALLKAGANKVEVEKLAADRNVERLAALVGRLF